MKIALRSALVAVVALSAACLAQDDANSIIRRSVEANAVDWKAAPGYDYFERDAQPGGGTKTYHELMILGSPYERLVAVNRKPLSPERQAQEQQKAEAAIVQRQGESAEDREKRIEKYKKERERDHVLMDQLTKALDFELVGQQKLGPYKVYVLKATPRPGYDPPNYEAKVLTGMKGKLWIDKKTFQWVKVEATVISPVSIAGFLAKVEPGTHFELQTMPVADGIWLPKHFAMKSRAKVLYFFPRKSKADETYWGYHKAAQTASVNGVSDSDHVQPLATGPGSMP